jgi:uncharacterized cupredoxin-like copper-binding protein
VHARAERPRGPRQPSTRRATTTWRSALAPAAALVALALAAAGCSSKADAAPGAVRIDATVKDFTIRLSRTRVPAGDVVFEITNQGPSTHEFKLVRTDLRATDLPMLPGGLSVNDDSAALHPVRDVEDAEAGSHTRLVTNLRPGHYVIYCNFEGHYLGGLRADLDVTTKGTR